MEWKSNVSDETKELVFLERDREQIKAELTQEAERMNLLLKNGMGLDMKRQLEQNTNIVVRKIPFFQRVKYKITRFFDFLFETF